MALSSERLQECDERTLVGIRQPRLSLAGREIVGSEVVTFVDYEVSALGDPEQFRNKRFEHLARLVVVRPRWQGIQFVFDIQQKSKKNHGIRLQVDIRQQIDRRTLGNGADGDA